MARRASLTQAKTGTVLNLPAETPTPVRGDSLFERVGDDVVTQVRTLEEVPLDRLRPNPFQPRWAVDEATVTELAHSMQRRGFFGALTARPQGRWYELAYGHQRLEAARRAGLAALPIEVRELSDEEMLEFALAENLQRKDLSQLEEGEIFQRWQTDLGRSERQIAERLGKSRGYVHNRLETARLPEDLRAVLRAQAVRPAVEVDALELPARFDLSPAAAKELARVTDPEQRRRLLVEVQARQLSFAQTRLLVQRSLRPPRAASEDRPPLSDQPFGQVILRLEREVRRVRPAERSEAIRALEELIARAEQLRDTLRTQRG